MFNYNIYNQKVREREALEQKKEQFMKSFKKREIQGKKMVERHQKRIMDFIVNMNEQPLSKPDYGVHHQHTFRDETVDKFIGPSKLTFNNYQNNRKSVLGYLNQNVVDDSESRKGRWKTHEFRDRDRSKEIHSNHMIFRSNNVENIKRMISNQPQKYLVRHQNFHSQAYDDYMMNKKDEGTEHMSRISQIMATQLMPDLNEKFHFKSVATLFNNLPSSLKHGHMDNNMNLLKMQNNEDQDMCYDVMDNQSKSQTTIKTKQVNHDRKSSNTKLILKNSGIITDRNTNVKVLFKGQGINSSNQDMSIDEIYKIINQSKN